MAAKLGKVLDAEGDKAAAFTAFYSVKLLKFIYNKNDKFYRVFVHFQQILKLLNG